jgi:hypothetical protein
VGRHPIVRLEGGRVTREVDHGVQQPAHRHPVRQR